jgi:hypothetical protein
VARKFDEAANFGFMQLIEQEPSMYNKCHPGCARWDKTDLACGRICHEMESGMCIYFVIKTYNRIQIQNKSAKGAETK